MKTERLSLRVDPDLKLAILAYAKRNKTSVSDLVTRFFVRLLKHEEKEPPQI